MERRRQSGCRLTPCTREGHQKEGRVAESPNEDWVNVVEFNGLVGTLPEVMEAKARRASRHDPGRLRRPRVAAAAGLRLQPAGWAAAACVVVRDEPPPVGPERQRAERGAERG